MISADERNFERPNEFIPERWTSKPELIKNTSVYSPFSIGEFYHAYLPPARKPNHTVLSCLQLADMPGTGPYNCVGKQLALMEIRSVTCSILRRYNVELAPGQTKEAFVDGLVDGFTAASPKLDLIFTPRE
jgi:cytochrome P450